MGFAVVNLGEKYADRIPPQHFSVVATEKALLRYRALVEAGTLVVLPYAESRSIGPRPLRGRFEPLRQEAIKLARERTAAGPDARAAEARREEEAAEALRVKAAAEADRERAAADKALLEKAAEDLGN